jgi:hypothetical protein
MVSIAISSIVIAGVLSAFLFFSKTSLTFSNYYDMLNENQQLMQYLSRDIREASDITWIDSNSCQLLVKGVNITYTYDSSEKTVSRSMIGQPSRILATGVKELHFLAYKINGDQISLNSNLDDASSSTKMIQVTGILDRKTSTSTDKTTSFSSARHMLRNKAVSAPGESL